MFNQFFCIAGPCVIEGPEATVEQAGALVPLFREAGVPLYFKASFDKANRTSHGSYRGPGLDVGLAVLAEIKTRFSVAVVTDIHEPWQAEPVGKVCDIIQIPALLCRQTDLLAAAASTGKPVHIKKGQFMAPAQMAGAVAKARQAAAKAGYGNAPVLVCERGTSFGYNNLVVDMRGLPMLAEATGCPVVFDATHSVQLPGALGEASGGQREFVAPIARAALATGAVNGLFFETHPDPDTALCDGPNMVPFADVPAFLHEMKALHAWARSTRQGPVA